MRSHRNDIFISTISTPKEVKSPMRSHWDLRVQSTYSRRSGDSNPLTLFLHLLFSRIIPIDSNPLYSDFTLMSLCFTWKRLLYGAIISYLFRDAISFLLSRCYANLSSSFERTFLCYGRLNFDS